MLSDDETQITQHSTQYFMINMILYGNAKYHWEKK